jgi:4'-phosphopantetheinyl transferase EntD
VIALVPMEKEQALRRATTRKREDLAGKCVARETLGLLKGLTSPDIFRQIIWENGTRVFNVRF